jgi:hypothetical protein
MLNNVINSIAHFVSCFRNKNQTRTKTEPNSNQNNQTFKTYKIFMIFQY